MYFTKARIFAMAVNGCYVTQSSVQLLLFILAYVLSLRFVNRNLLHEYMDMDRMILALVSWLHADTDHLLNLCTDIEIFAPYWQRGLFGQGRKGRNHGHGQ